MFEEMSYENILKRALERVPNERDKREGAVIYDALAPACAELAQMYICLDFLLENFFVETMTEENAVKRAAEIGIERKNATKAVVLAQMSGDFSMSGGERFSCDEVNFRFTGEKVGDYYKLTCESEGAVGNINEGTLTAIDNIIGLERAEIAELYEKAADIEKIEALKERYYAKIRKTAASGNKYDYYNWAAEVEGVGGCKVEPLWNGNGTVRVIICGNEKEEVGEELVKRVWEHIEEERPIGADVTVASVKETLISVSAKVDLGEGALINDVKHKFEERLNEYFSGSFFNAEKAFEKEKISLSKIQNMLYETDGVNDYENVTVNGVGKSMELEIAEIPKLKKVGLEELL